MSIDQYTGVVGGGAVNQFHKWLGQTWTLDDHSVDMCRMRYVPTSSTGDIITLTIGGNDLLADMQHYLENGLERFASEHLKLLESIREINPDALFIVGNVYAPQSLFTEKMKQALAAANDAIAQNTMSVDASLANIREAFRGHERDFLCYDIEPSLNGAKVIAELFSEQACKALPDIH